MTRTIQFFVPTNTPVHYHRQGRPYNLYHDFVPKLTEKDVHFDLADVWYIADANGTKLLDHLQPEDITRDTPEGWPAELQRSIGFKLPDNSLGIDYIVVPFTWVKWERVKGSPQPTPTASAAPAASSTETAEHLMRRMHQQSGGYYFPGQLPS